MSCGVAELFPVRFEYVLGLFIALKKQLEDEEKARKKAEEEQSGGGKADVSSYMGQANSMMRSAQNSVPKMSTPHISTPHL